MLVLLRDVDVAARNLDFKGLQWPWWRPGEDIPGQVEAAVRAGAEKSFGVALMADGAGEVGADGGKGPELAVGRVDENGGRRPEPGKFGRVWGPPPGLGRAQPLGAGFG